MELGHNIFGFKKLQFTLITLNGATNVRLISQGFIATLFTRCQDWADHRKQMMWD